MLAKSLGCFTSRATRISLKRRSEPVASKPMVRFLLVGDGTAAAQSRTPDSRGRMNALFPARWAFAGRRKFPPWLPRWISWSNHEPAGGARRAFVQRPLAGKPVVGFDIDGAREVEVDVHDGRLVPPRDSRALAAALQRLTGRPALNPPRRAGEGPVQKEWFCHQLHDPRSSAPSTTPEEVTD